MTGRRLRRLAGVTLILSLLAFAALTAGLAEEIAPTGPVKIGMVGDLLKEVPDPLLAAMQQPFSTVMAQQTGLAGQLIRSGDAAQLAKQLADDKVQLGIFYGVEFAWARQKYPELKPLMICVNKHPDLRACLLVRSNAKTAGFADLRGQIMTQPKLNLQHCTLFLRGLCQTQGLSPEQFAGKILETEDFEEALDHVVDGTAGATVIDAVSVECYQRRKPGRFAQLKVLEKSVAFPSTCVAYHSGRSLNMATLKRFKQGMTNANQTYLGKRMFNLFRMTAFAPVPNNYEQHLQEILKSYPAPAEVQISGEAIKP